MDLKSKKIDPLELGAAIRERRKELGLRQVDLAVRLGMPQPTLSRIEIGKSFPSLGTLKHIFDQLGLELTLVIGLKDEDGKDD